MEQHLQSSMISAGVNMDYIDCSNTEFIPCSHQNKFQCNCLTEEQSENTLYRKHWASLCTFDECHGHLYGRGNGFYVVDKPTWKHNCRVNLTPSEIYYLEFFSKLFKLECSCTTAKMCKLCKNIVLTKNSRPPVLHIDNNNKLNLKRIKALAPFINFSRALV